MTYVPQPETRIAHALELVTDALREAPTQGEVNGLRLEVERLKQELATARVHQHTTADEYRRKAQDLAQDVEDLSLMLYDALAAMRKSRHPSYEALRIQFRAWEDAR